MRDLSVTLVQQPLVWEDPSANRAHFEALLNSASPETDLIVLPEMFTTGFSMNARAIAEPVGGDTQIWMQSMARAFDCAVVGSVPTQEDGCVYNRLLFASSDKLATYDKRHLFRMAGEHEHYTSGSERVVIEWREWRIKPEICYDLRFPAFSRNRGDYDLLMFIANWPSPRAQHWRTLLQARAIENLACVVGVNRVGSDANGLDYVGDSMAIDQRGVIAVDLGACEGIETLAFSGAALDAYRERFPTQLDADDFYLNL